MDIILIGGLWLHRPAWDSVVPLLEKAGHHPTAVLLPGQGDDSANATLGDQLTAVTHAIDSCAGPVMVVGHSAACTLAWMAADARAEKTAQVVMIGGFPSADGETYADFFAYEDGVMPFPGWEQFDGPDSRDLDQELRDRMTAGFVPVPEAVAKGVVHLRDKRRYDVPVAVVCPEFSVNDAQQWVADGIPELQNAKHVSYVDIDSGHWPMFSRPAELARLLSKIANG